MARKPKLKHKTLEGAKRHIRQLQKQVKALHELLTRFDKERISLAKLSAETPQFTNPLDVYEAKQTRDAILKYHFNYDKPTS